MWKVELVLTRDGSYTLYVPELKESYHSGMGALTDTQYIYIGKGLNYFRENIGKEIKILEMGFGTGLNAFFTLKEAFCDPELKITYTTLEAYPVSPSLVKHIDYEDLMPVKEVAARFQELHSCPWNEKIQIIPNFTFEKIQTKLEDFQASEKYDLVYYDAFSPGRQPELWTFDTMKKVYDLMSENSVLVTYCAKGQFKRDLKSIGFTVEPLKGMTGKREMTRAFKIN